MFRNIRAIPFSFTIFSFLILLTSCQNHSTQATKAAANLNQLLGKWQSVENPKNQIELTETRMFSYFGDLKLADESLVIYPVCKAGCLPIGMKPMPCFVTDGKRAENCFKVLELTPKKLTYTPIGNEEKVMTFQRM